MQWENNSKLIENTRLLLTQIDCGVTLISHHVVEKPSYAFSLLMPGGSSWYGISFQITNACNVLSLSPKMLHDNWQSFHGTFNFVSFNSKFFGEFQPQSVHVWMLFNVSSVLSVWVTADLLRSEPRSLLSLCFCVCATTLAQSVFIKCVSLLTCLHGYCSFQSPNSPTSLPPSAHIHLAPEVKEMQRICLLSRSAAPHPPFSPWLPYSLCLCQSDTAIKTP